MVQRNTKEQRSTIGRVNMSLLITEPRFTNVTVTVVMPRVATTVGLCPTYLALSTCSYRFEVITYTLTCLTR